MWLIASLALDKVGPSICVYSASIGRIMHDTGLIGASRITVRAVPVVVIEMNGMPMARQFPFGDYMLRLAGHAHAVAGKVTASGSEDVCILCAVVGFSVSPRRNGGKASI